MYRQLEYGYLLTLGRAHSCGCSLWFPTVIRVLAIRPPLILLELKYLSLIPSTRSTLPSYQKYIKLSKFSISIMLSNCQDALHGTHAKDNSVVSTFLHKVRHKLYNKEILLLQNLCISSCRPVLVSLSCKYCTTRTTETLRLLTYGFAKM